MTSIVLQKQVTIGLVGWGEPAWICFLVDFGGMMRNWGMRWSWVAKALLKHFLSASERC